MDQFDVDGRTQSTNKETDKRVGMNERRRIRIRASIFKSNRIGHTQISLFYAGVDTGDCLINVDITSISVAQYLLTKSTLHVVGNGICRIKYSRVNFKDMGYLDII